MDSASDLEQGAPKQGFLATLLAVCRASLSEAPLRVGYTLILLLFGGFGGWAVFAPLESSAIAVGAVQVQGNSKPIQHLEGGIVSEILVSNGDFVAEGEPLLSLDRTVIQAELGIVRGKIWTQQARSSRLIAERDGQESVTFDQELNEIDDPRAVVARDSETALFMARSADKRGEIDVAQQRIDSLETQIVGAEEVLDAKNTVVDSIKGDLAELEKLLTDGFIDKQRIRELNRSLARALGEAADMEARKGSLLIAKQEAQLELLQIDKRFQTQVVDQLTVTQESLFDLKQRFEALEDRDTRSIITAPNSGVVLDLSVNTIGEVVRSGETILSIVPDVDHLIVRAKFSPMDIDRIEIGQLAEVRFSVFKDAYSITGVLTQVSADALIDDITGATYFDAVVELMAEDMPLLGNNKLSPGMPAQVLVKTGTRNFISYLTSSLRNMFAESLTEE